MKKLLFPNLIFLAITGCALIGKNGYTEFEPYKNAKGEPAFKYTARSSASMPAFSTDSENARMEWLQMWLDESEICSNGYSIYERKEVDLGQGMAIQNIIYTGQCKYPNT